MSFFDDIQQVAIDLLGPGSDSFGEPITIKRPVASYDPVTRKTGNTAPLEQEVYGTFDSELVPTTSTGSFTKRFAQILTAVPTTGGFEPGAGDRVVWNGQVWQVMETGNIIKQGIPLLWVCGLEST